MPLDATQGTGAEMADIESIFADEPDNGNQLQEQNIDPNGKQPAEEVQVEVDADGNLIQSENLDADPDLELELNADPNAEAETGLVIPDDHMVKLTVDGQEIERPFSELVAGAQKYEAANKRFEEAAAIRKEYVEKSQGIATREQQLGQVLQYYIDQSQQFIQAQQPDWNKLLQDNPQEYLIVKHNWDLKQKQLQDAQIIQQNVQRQQAERDAAAAAQRVEEARQKLTSTIPEWTDPHKAAEGAVAIDNYLQQQGITPQMRAQIDTAEVLLIARKAMLYDQAIAKQQQARRAGGSQNQSQQQGRGQQVRTQGRVERPGAGRSAAQNAASQANLAKANANKAFSQNPSVDTLAGFFE
jgi:hypothetical protein